MVLPGTNWTLPNHELIGKVKSGFMLYLLNSGILFHSVPSVAIVGPEVRYSWLLEVRDIRFLHIIWIPLVR